MWPLLEWSFVLPGLIQPYSFTSLLQKVFLLAKWRVLRHRHVSQENAPSIAFFCGQTDPVCLGALFHLERSGFASLRAGVGRKPRTLAAGQGGLAAFPAVMLFTPKCTWLLGEEGFATASLRCAGWDSAGSAVAGGTQPSVPAWRAVLLTVCRSAVSRLEKHLGWVVWRANAGLCRELRELCSSRRPPLKIWADLTLFSLISPWNEAWCFSTPLCVLWEAVMIGSISMCLTLWEHKADPFLAALHICKVFEILYRNHSKIFLFYLS